MVSFVHFTVLFLVLNGISSFDLKDNFNKFKDFLKNPADLAKLAGHKDPERLHKYFEHLKGYNKTLEDVDELIKKADIFKKNLDIAKELQELHGDAAEFGETIFSDLEPEEFLKRHTGLKLSDHSHPEFDENNAPQKLSSNRSKRSLETNFDWRNQGIITPVKNQGSCGCCYAFATVAVLEALYKHKNGKELLLSEEDLVDCSSTNYGCNGGSSMGSLEYIQKKGGLNSQSNYPFSANNGKASSCKSQSGWKRYANISKAFTYNDNGKDANEDNMRQKLKDYGPMFIVIDASPLQSYKSGIIKAKAPSGGWKINHGVTIVGWGSESGTDYWIAKNSWSSNFGEKGYFRFVRNQNCMRVGCQPVSFVLQ